MYLIISLLRIFLYVSLPVPEQLPTTPVPSEPFRLSIFFMLLLLPHQVLILWILGDLSHRVTSNPSCIFTSSKSISLLFHHSVHLLLDLLSCSWWSSVTYYIKYEWLSCCRIATLSNNLPLPQLLWLAYDSVLLFQMSVISWQPSIPMISPSLTIRQFCIQIGWLRTLFPNASPVNIRCIYVYVHASIIISNVRYWPL